MKNIQTNIAELEEARAEVLAHCMCAKLVEEKDRFIVFFPMGFQADAAQMRFAQEGVSKTNALRLLLETMEKYWGLA